MGLIQGIIAISIGVVMLANVFMFVVHNTSTTGWSGSEAALWAVLGLMGVIGLVYGVAAVFGLV